MSNEWNIPPGEFLSLTETFLKILKYFKMLNRNIVHKYSPFLLIFILIYRECVHYNKNNSLKEKSESKEPSGGSNQFIGAKRR